MKKTMYTVCMMILVGLTSCSKQDYTNSIPANSTALIAVNAADFVGEQSPFSSLLMPFVDNDKKELKGIDLTKDIYLFAAGDGQLGLCAPISNDNELHDFMKRLYNLGVITNHTEKDNKNFYTFNNQWVIGYNDNTMLIMGPVTGADAEMRLARRLEKLMDKDEAQSIKNTMLWQHLEEKNSHIRMVAQASTLPEQMAATVTIGAPKGTDPADVLLEADMEYNDGTLMLTGNTCSYNPNIKQSMKKAQALYRPITIDWQKMMTDTTLIGVFMNVDGKRLIPQLQNNRTLGTMLMGTEAYDQIRNTDGNLAILLSPNKETEENSSVFTAQIHNLPNEKNDKGERLVVAVNMEALNGTIAQTITPLLGKVKRIIYNLNAEQ